MASIIKIPLGFPYANCTLEEMISAEEVQKRVSEIGCDISEAYRNKVPIIIGVLNGAFIFMADLVRTLDINFEVDFIKIDSYGDGTQSSGTVRLLKDISADITNRHVIVVEDIVDTGLSIKFLKHRMKEASPKSLRFASFLYKMDVANENVEIDWIGFNIDEQYVVGYGLDLKQVFRGLQGIYFINEKSNNN